MEIMAVFILIFMVGLIYTLIRDVGSSKSPKGHEMDSSDILNQQLTNQMNQQHMQIIEEMNRQQHEQLMNFSTEEAQKSVTPFEQGGYDMTQGNSFNDTNSFNNDL